MKNLVIVESPAKARTITKFLGDDYTVLASMGHIRDLPEKKLGFDPDNNFEPEYEISPDKKKIVSQLKKQVGKDTIIYLATDEDREGEAISWHLVSALQIKKNTIKRIVFHEITKEAILQALKTPRDIDQHLVDAQQARRILDRAVGYKLSPLLWKKVARGLSAGRVQSVAVRIIVDREREIRAFVPEEFWKIKADFIDPSFQAELSKIEGKTQVIPHEQRAKEIETSAKNGTFIVKSVEEKKGKRSPAPPFTTSTLQQEASRKLGFSVKQTMVIAQRLYEGNFDIPGYSGGLITYMRTDSVNLSEQALKQAKNVITDEFGKEYALSSPRYFKNKSKGAQEAHEAIRPVDLSMTPSKLRDHLDSQNFKLYDLIWKRTLATQMVEADINNTTIKIEAGEKKELEFDAKGERILFPGFMQAYTEGSDNPEEMIANKEKILPKVEEGQKLNLEKLFTEQHFTKPPARYTEASLVKKLESEGIGRPSTYAPTISTIQDRGYIEKTEDKKLKPTDIGEVVNDFLVKHFSDIVDLGFTAKKEEELDEIAEGKKQWTAVLKVFYQPFINQIKEKEETVSKNDVVQMKELGIDKKSGRPVTIRVGRYGPMIQIGTKDDEEKPLFASLPKGKSIADMTLEEALKLFELPKVVGKDEQGEDIIVNQGRFGPYVKVKNEFYSIKNEDPFKMTLEKALEVIKSGQEKKKQKVIKVFEKEDIQVLNGPYGPYIKQGKKNYKIPKDQEAEKLTVEDCQKIIKEAPEKTRRFTKKKKQ